MCSSALPIFSMKSLTQRRNFSRSRRTTRSRRTNSFQMPKASAGCKNRSGFTSPRKRPQLYCGSLQDLVNACRRHAKTRFIAPSFHHAQKSTFKTKRETCPATMAQIQQNIILKKCMWLTLGEIAQILSLLNTRANRSLSRKTARQYPPSQRFLKPADGTFLTPLCHAALLCALCIMLHHRYQIIWGRFAL